MPGFAGRCFLSGWRKATQPLTCTHFDPTIFLNFQKKVVVSHRPNEPIYLSHGTSFRVQLEKGNTGGHGASQGQEVCGERKETESATINWTDFLRVCTMTAYEERLTIKSQV